MEAVEVQRTHGPISSEQDKANLIASMTWLIQLRWYAIVVFAIVSILFAGVFGILPSDRLLALFAVLAICAGCNFGFTRHLESVPERTFEQIFRDALLQVILDLCALTLFVHFSGGVENPLIIATALPLIAACWLLPRATCNTLAAFALFLLATVAVFEATGVLGHTQLSFMSDSPVWNRAGYIVLWIVSLAGLFFGAIHFTASLVSRLNEQRAQSVERADTLGHKVDTIEALLEKEQIERTKLEETIRRQAHDTDRYKTQLASEMRAIESGVKSEIEKLSVQAKQVRDSRGSHVTDLERDVAELRESLEALAAASHASAGAMISNQAIQEPEAASDADVAVAEPAAAKRPSGPATRAARPAADEEDDEEDEEEYEDEEEEEDEEYEDEEEEGENDLADPADSVSEALLAAVRNVEGAPEAEAILMDVVLSEKLPETAADPDVLKELFAGLLGCSVASMPDGGRISIATSYTDGEIRVSITDSSEPSSESILPKLTAEKRLVKKIHGTLSASAAIDEGVTYRVQIPASEASA